MVTRTNEAFTEVTASATRVGDLIAEIAAASSEQAQGIDQVNTAVADMDKVTQQNAASAEESASAAQQMNAQAEHMRHMVSRLTGMVKKSATPNNSSEVAHTAVKPAVMAELKRPRKPIAQPASAHPADPSPEMVIPLNEDNFQDF